MCLPSPCTIAALQNSELVMLLILNLWINVQVNCKFKLQSLTSAKLAELEAKNKESFMD